MTAIRTMYQLQQVEAEIAEKRRRLQVVLKGIEGDGRLAELREAAESAVGRREAAERRFREIDLSLSSLRDKLKTTKQRLYAGSVTASKELSALESEVGSLGRREAELDRQTVEAMEEIETLTVAEGGAAEALRLATEARSGDLLALQQERSEIEERIQSLDQRQQQLKGLLTPADLDLYQDLAKRRGGRPIACVTKMSACSMCGVAVPNGLRDQARAAQAYVHCGSCERLLIVE